MKQLLLFNELLEDHQAFMRGHWLAVACVFAYFSHCFVRTQLLSFPVQFHQCFYVIIVLGSKAADCLSSVAQVVSEASVVALFPQTWYLWDYIWPLFLITEWMET